MRRRAVRIGGEKVREGWAADEVGREAGEGGGVGEDDLEVEEEGGRAGEVGRGVEGDR